MLTGGEDIILLRSANLTRGSWQLAGPPAVAGSIFSADQGDCKLAGAPYGGWYTPSPAAAAHIAACERNPRGFGDDSDVDITEIVLDSRACAALLIEATPPATAAALHSPALCGIDGRGASPPSPATLFQYGSGDQATFGFSNLAIAPGAVFDVLGSFF